MRPLLTLACVLLAVPVGAQTVRSASGDITLSSNGDSFVFLTRGLATVRIQTLDSYTGTWEVQCSADGGSTYDTDDELNLILDGQSATVQEVSDTIGIWSANVAGCTHIKVIATAGFAASDTTFAVHGISVGGGVGGALDTSSLASDRTEDAAHTDGDTGPAVLSRRIDTPASSAGTSGDYATFNTNANGALWVSQIDPCASETKTTDPFSLTADAVIIAATASKKNHICVIVVVAGAAEIVSIIEGTGSVCASNRAALVGSTTDANGLSFAANGGFVGVGGNSTVIAGKTANVDTCLNVSGSNRVSGFVTWVQR